MCRFNIFCKNQCKNLNVTDLIKNILIRNNYAVISSSLKEFTIFYQSQGVSVNVIHGKYKAPFSIIYDRSEVEPKISNPRKTMIFRKTSAVFIGAGLFSRKESFLECFDFIFDEDVYGTCSSNFAEQSNAIVTIVDLIEKISQHGKQV